MKQEESLSLGVKMELYQILKGSCFLHSLNVNLTTSQ